MLLRRLPFRPAAGGAHWTVSAIAASDGTCQLEEFFAEHQAGPLAGNVGEMIALLEQLVVDPRGPMRWEGTPRSHESVKGEHIFEFRVGRLRVHWFYGQPKQVAILAVGVVKRTQATPKDLAKKLKRLKSQYEADHEEGNIVYV